MPPPVLVTRPAREADHWVAQLAQHGIAAEALPLIDIAPLASPALDDARTRTRRGDFRALMFVSGNAVTAFFANPTTGCAGWPQGMRAWSPGPGTARALLEAGVPAATIDGPAADAPQFDSEALWQVVAPQVRPGDRVLIVRGTSEDAGPAPEGTGRDWLARRIAEAGGGVETVAAYQRCAPFWGADAQARAQAAARDGTLWLFSSSEAIGHLRTLLPEGNWGAARALATHPRIAEAARSAGFGLVTECRPALRDVVASIESTR